MKNKMKLISLLLLSALLLCWVSGIATAYDTPAASEDFVDLANHWAAKPMEQLIDMGIVNGYEKPASDLSDPTYPEYYIKPDKLITRAEFATILAKALGLSKSTSAYFRDTKGHWAEGYINALHDENIASGYGGGKYIPEGKITRGEIVTMLVQALDNKEAVTNTVYFADLAGKNDHWSWDFVQKAVTMDIIKGYPDGTFRPDGRAKRAEVMTMLVNFLNNDSTAEGLPADDDLLTRATGYQKAVETIIKSPPDDNSSSAPLDWTPAYEYVTGGEKLNLDGLSEIFNLLAESGTNYGFEISELSPGQVVSKSNHTAVVKQYGKMSLKVGPEEKTLEGDILTYLMKENGKWLVYSNPEIEE